MGKRGGGRWCVNLCKLTIKISQIQWNLSITTLEHCDILSIHCDVYDISAKVFPYYKLLYLSWHGPDNAQSDYYQWLWSFQKSATPRNRYTECFSYTQQMILKWFKYCLVSSNLWTNWLLLLTSVRSPLPEWEGVYFKVYDKHVYWGMGNNRYPKHIRFDWDCF